MDMSYFYYWALAQTLGLSPSTPPVQKLSLWLKSPMPTLLLCIAVKYTLRYQGTCWRCRRAVWEMSEENVSGHGEMNIVWGVRSLLLGAVWHWVSQPSLDCNALQEESHITRYLQLDVLSWFWMHGEGSRYHSKYSQVVLKDIGLFVKGAGHHVQ